MTFTYALDGSSPGDPTTDVDLVRLLLNDVDDATHVFEDEELTAILALEGGTVKLAAAQAIDTNADNEALASKVLRSQDVQTDGAKLADALRKHAQALRDQHYNELEGDGSFEVVEFAPGHRPEHTNPFFNGWY